MHKGKSIIELAQEVQSIADRAEDFVAPGAHLNMVVEQQGDEAPQPMLRMGETSPMPINGHAHSQFAGRLEIPQRYYDKMKNHDPELLAHNVNTWLHEKESKGHMIRTLREPVEAPAEGVATLPATRPTVRAFMSDRYRRMDNLQLLASALPVMRNPDAGIEFCSADVTETRIYIQARFPRIEGEVKVGDPVQAGFVIRNSEVGCGALDISPMIYRLVCTNGMITGTTLDNGRLRKTHVGRKTAAGEDYTIYTDETKEADDRALMLKIRDSIAALSNPELFMQLMEEMKAAAESKPLHRPIPAVEQLAKSHGLLQGEHERVLENLLKDQDYTKWGVLNAVTAVANDHRNYDRAIELEEMGSRIMRMPNKEWQTLVDAA